MSDLKKYINKRKIKDKDFSRNFEEGYKHFKISVMLKQARESVGQTQEELVRQLGTKKSAISRIESHAGDIKLSTQVRVAEALGKSININIV